MIASNYCDKTTTINAAPNYKCSNQRCWVEKLNDQDVIHSVSEVSVKAHPSHMGTNLLSKSVPECIHWLINLFYSNFIRMAATDHC